VPLSVRFWLARVDLLSLPLFVAGAITLTFGVRRLWTLRFPVAFLLLAWPALYLPIITSGADLLTAATLQAVRWLTGLVPVAQVAGDGDLFLVRHAGSFFQVVVASACAGVNSLIGYLLVATGLAYVVAGPMRRRIAWLATGLLLIWLLNVARIMAIFVIGTLFGRDAALDVLHPVAGLLVFNAGVLLMIWLIPRFGLRFRQFADGRPKVSPVIRHRRMHVAFVSLTGAIALLLAGINAGYARYEPLVNGLGNARMAALDGGRDAVEGWDSRFVAAFDGGRPYFGDTSTWMRYQYLSRPTAELQASVPLTLDVISVDDPNALAAYGLEQCYRFHGYLIESKRPVLLAEGLVGEVISYNNPKQGAEWSAVWWEWPTQSGARTSYQRVVLFVVDGAQADLEGVEVTGDGRLDQLETFLTRLAGDIAASHLALAGDS
jgi:exosortase